MSHYIGKIAFLGNYQPRLCGIATFTTDLCEAVAKRYPETGCWSVAMNDTPDGYAYPERVRFEFEQEDADAYIRAANFLNLSGADVLCMQHEYGIYGGESGRLVLGLLKELNMPVVSTLHTILQEPSPVQHEVLREIADVSAALVVMSERGRMFLQDIYDISPAKIELIPHGIHDVPFIDPNYYKDQYQVEGKNVLLTFGLLSPNKGIEEMIEALPQIVAARPNTVYLVLGATHPHLVRHEGERYRNSLKQRARELGVAEHVIFHNRFVNLNELMEFIGAADIYVTPYLNEAQITSGTLAYAVGAGKAVVSTPYWHAQELLADGRGVLVPFHQPTAMADAILDLLQNETRRHAIRKRAYTAGRKMVWEKSAEAYMDVFERVLLQGPRQKKRASGKEYVKTLTDELPPLKLDHLIRLTDSTGMLQHAIYEMPNYHEGYCIDDNARALILTAYCEDLDEMDHALTQDLAGRYLSFIHYAYNPEKGRFRNFLSYDRRWLESMGSEDSHGRTLWALGVVLGRSRNRRFQQLAADLFLRSIPAIEKMTSPRAWAFALLGIHEYFQRFYGDRKVNAIRERLASRLLALYQRYSSTDWPWFEDRVTYSNARLSHALILSGRWLQHGAMTDAGLASLTWLQQIQTNENGLCSFVGNDGFYPRTGTMARFDQQPIEAAAGISACLEALLMTGNDEWEHEVLRMFNWFHGKNEIGLALYAPETGGCRDGLGKGRVNKNQGAESTLAYLLALAEIKLVRQLMLARNKNPGEEI